MLGPRLGITSTSGLGSDITLVAEVREGAAAVCVSDGAHRFSSPIVDVTLADQGHAGLIADRSAGAPEFDRFEVRESPELPHEEALSRRLYDAHGVFRGEFNTPGVPELERAGLSGWNDYGKRKLILLDEYRPPRLPFAQDWLLTLEAESDHE